MRKLITNDETNCVGCNRCIRACPVEGANIVYDTGSKIKVHVDNERCIACGACIGACRHGVRDYDDDTEKFINDLRNGVPISMFAAPANRVNGQDGGRLLAWLRKIGVKKIYDVSLGADICTWAHIRHIQKENPKSLITQPCPVIVNYILMKEHNLIKYLSPIHSPMLCTAIYMKKYDGVTDRIAALSPCIAKAHEFDATNGYVNYNVTLKKLYEYIEKHNIELPENPKDSKDSCGFDHPDSALGRLYSMPGGLRENVEFYFGKKMRIDQAEGLHVYDALRQFSKENGNNLPVIFDVLNCAEGCNIGTGCIHDRSRFEICSLMDKGRQDVLEQFDRQRCEKLYREYDKKLNTGDFIRKYTPVHIPSYNISGDQIELAFAALNKFDEVQKKFDCGACGSDSCADMARKIALNINVPENCMQKEKEYAVQEHENLLHFKQVSTEHVKRILNDNTDIKKISDEIVVLIKNINDSIEGYDKMAKDIGTISSSINLISFNASIEAARAGEHGKTFAAVAEEIRALANNSQATVGNAAKISEQAAWLVAEINDKIENISESLTAANTDISTVYKDVNELFL